MTEETTMSDQMENAIDINKYNEALQQLERLSQEVDLYKHKHSEAEKHRKQIELEARKKSEEAARNSGDLKALEESWNEKFNSATNTIKERDQIISELTVGSTATALATELALDGYSEALLPHIQQRLTTDWIDGKPVVKVLVNGKPSALTIDDLKAEISETKAFAPLLKGISASGSGNISNGSGGKSTMKRDRFESLSHVEKSRFIKEGGSVID